MKILGSSLEVLDADLVPTLSTEFLSVAAHLRIVGVEDELSMTSVGDILIDNVSVNHCFSASVLAISNIFARSDVSEILIDPLSSAGAITALMSLDMFGSSVHNMVFGRLSKFIIPFESTHWPLFLEESDGFFDVRVSATWLGF